MRFRIPQTYTLYRVLADHQLKSINVTQTRDLRKAKKSAHFDDANATIILPIGTIFQLIRLDGNIMRIEIMDCTDSNLKRVKFYIHTTNVENIEIEPD
jgi:hypothetical protein